MTSTIIGARRVAQLDDNLRSLELTLTAADLAQLDELTKPTLDWPARMLPFFPAIHNGGVMVNGHQLPPSSFVMQAGEKPY